MKIFDKILVIAVVLFASSCTKDKMPTSVEVDNQLRAFMKSTAENGRTDYYILPDEDDLDNIPQDPKNPLTKEKVELGKLLFFDTGLAMDAKHSSGLGTYSCASCHIPNAGFRPGRAQGIADGGIGFGVNGENRVKNRDYEGEELDAQGARPLTLVNVAYVTNTFWNGQFGATEVNVGTEDVWDLNHDTELNHLGFHGIETQNMEGVLTHRLSFEKEILDQYGYTEMFDAAFSDYPVSERYGHLTGSLALSAYIRTIISNQSPFQKWLKGDDLAMSIEEKQGAVVFFGKARCNNCHYRPNLGSLEFHTLGVNDMHQIPSFNTSEDDFRNLGRGAFTRNRADNYKFKVPGLYNLADAPFFFHGSSARTLEEAIDYKIKAQSENPNIGQHLISDKFLPLTLTEEERENLLLFLSQSLRDPQLIRYQPEEVLSGFCFPNNDLQSSIDLGCN